MTQPISETYTIDHWMTDAANEMRAKGWTTANADVCQHRYVSIEEAEAKIRDAYAEGALDETKRRHPPQATATETREADLPSMPISIQSMTASFVAEPASGNVTQDWGGPEMDYPKSEPATVPSGAAGGEAVTLRAALTKLLWSWAARVMSESLPDLERHAYDVCERQVQRILDEASSPRPEAAETNRITAEYTEAEAERFMPELARQVKELEDENSQLERENAQHKRDNQVISGLISERDTARTAFNEMKSERDAAREALATAVAERDGLRAASVNLVDDINAIKITSEVGHFIAMRWRTFGDGDKFDITWRTSYKALIKLLALFDTAPQPSTDATVAK